MSYRGDRSHDYHPKDKAHTRRPHRKSRNGCRSCKQRKIKCDEQKPACQNCIKLSLNCEYVTGQSPASCDALATASTENSTSLNLFDLELLHHFTTSTAPHINGNLTLQAVWTINIPKLGFKYDYVMHGILAFSALHLAYSYQERKDFYLDQARHHYHVGLRKGTPALAAFSDENATANYMFSVLTIMYNIASARFHDRNLLSEGVAEWIVLLRQSYGIVKLAAGIVHEGPVGQMFKLGARRATFQSQVPLDCFPGAEQMGALSSYIKENTVDTRVKEACTGAISALIKCYAVVYCIPPNQVESSDVFTWPYRVTDDYLELLQQSRQEALIILAFFAVLTTRVDSKWWSEGFGYRLMSVIYPLIDLNHLPWLKWPIKEIGWKPEEAGYTESQ